MNFGGARHVDGTRFSLHQGCVLWQVPCPRTLSIPKFQRYSRTQRNHLADFTLGHEESLDGTLPGS